MTFTITQLYMNNVIRHRINKLHIHKIGFLLKHTNVLSLFVVKTNKKCNHLFHWETV